MSLPSIQLDAFIAVCRTHNFTQAAEALHVTQSALSQRIKNLEEELGTTLSAELSDLPSQLFSGRAD